MVICDKCGMLADQAHNAKLALGLRVGRTSYCRNCEDGAHTREVAIPAAFRLLLHELMCFNVTVKLGLGNDAATS